MKTYLVVQILVRNASSRQHFVVVTVVNYEKTAGSQKRVEIPQRQLLIALRTVLVQHVSERVAQTEDTVESAFRKLVSLVECLQIAGQGEPVCFIDY